MTITHSARERVHGWRLDRVAGTPPRRTAAGRWAVAVWLLRDGERISRCEVVLTGSDVESIVDAIAGAA